MNTIIQILQSHNLIWTREQILIALAIIAIAALLLAIPLRRRQIGLREFFAGLGIVIYAVIILGSTVFFRPVIGAAYQLDPLVEYQAIAGGLAAAACNMAGNWVGSGLALSRGTKIVRPVILIVLALLLAKILFG